jgi:hypothetical protein
MADLVVYRFKVVLAGAAFRAHPVIGKIIE